LSNRKALTLATALLPGSRRPRSARPVGQSGRHHFRKNGLDTENPGCLTLSLGGMWRL
jgi:hypothetical protein